MKPKFIQNRFHVILSRKSSLYKFIISLILNSKYKIAAEICSNIYFTVKANKTVSKIRGFCLIKLNINPRFLSIEYHEFNPVYPKIKSYPYLICSDNFKKLFLICKLFNSKLFYIEKSDLFYFFGKYYLLIFPKTYYMDKLNYLILENTSLVRIDDIFYLKINEHGIPIIRGNAVSKINDYFNAE